MARVTNRLSARSVATLKRPGRHADGGGLYLSVSPDGSRRRWVFLYRWRPPGEKGPGKLREMGLGSASAISLARARELAADARALRAEGRNPLDERMRSQSVPTFGAMAEEVINALEGGWRNPKHRQQWHTTLSTHGAPLWDLPVNAIETEQVVSVLRPLWSRTPETASRLRGRIEKVLDAAKARGHRTGDNPARWRGHLAHFLSVRQRLTRGHHKAMPYSEVPQLVRKLRELGSISACCLEFVILTAARSGEAMGACWDEFDLDRAVWIVPASRMKAGREHRVPLAPRAGEIIATMGKLRASSFVFPGQKLSRPLSSMALAMLLRRLQVDATPHGFRSAFRDWAAERTNFPREVAEAALAHVLENKVEAAYRRSDLFEKRRQLMDAWAEFIDKTDAASGR